MIKSRFKVRVNYCYVLHFDYYFVNRHFCHYYTNASYYWASYTISETVFHNFDVRDWFAIDFANVLDCS